MDNMDLSPLGHLLTVLNSFLKKNDTFFLWKQFSVILRSFDFAQSYR